MARIAIRTLGCRLNRYESDLLAEALTAQGHEIVRPNDPADVYVVNTCTVTGRADRKSRNALYQAIQHAGDASLVVSTGCRTTAVALSLSPPLSQEARERIVEVPNDDKPQLAGIILDALDAMGTPRASMTPDAPHTPHAIGGEDVVGSIDGTDSATAGGRTRAMLKVHDGCDNRCTYCIIPHVRGPGRSRPIGDVVEDARGLLSRGFREIVLTGVNITRYSWSGRRLSDVLDAIYRLDGAFRVRLSSIEPDEIDERLINSIGHPSFTNHLHLCLQSGSDSVLQRMHRNYRAEDYLQIVERIRRVRPDVRLTTDVIVGFPGETPTDVEATSTLLREAGVAGAHVFPFSPRPHTAAAYLPDQIPVREAAARSAFIRATAEELARGFVQGLVGKATRLLVERTDGDVAQGFGSHYVRLRIPNAGVRRNTFVDCRITGTDGDGLLGVPISTET